MRNLESQPDGLAGCDAFGRPGDQTGAGLRAGYGGLCEGVCLLCRIRPSGDPERIEGVEVGALREG